MSNSASGVILGAAERMKTMNFTQPVMMAIDRLAATFRYYAGPETPGYEWHDGRVYDAIRTTGTCEATEAAIQSDLRLVAKAVIAAREEAKQ